MNDLQAEAILVELFLAFIFIAIVIIGASVAIILLEIEKLLGKK